VPPAVDEQGRGPTGAAFEGAVGIGLDPLPDGPAIQIGGEPVTVQPELVGIPPQVGILQGLS
jgi:hypothetical protein